MIKGSILDLFYIVAVIFAIAIVFLFSGFVLESFTDAVNESSVDFNMTVLETGESVVIDSLNYGFLFLAFGALIVTIISAFLIRTHPAFFVVSFIVLIFMVFLSGIFTNVFQEIATNSEVVATANRFDVMVVVMQNWPLFATIGGLLLLIVIYGKVRGANEL